MASSEPKNEALELSLKTTHFPTNRLRIRRLSGGKGAIAAL